MFNDKVVKTNFKLESEKLEDEIVDGPLEEINKPSTDDEKPQAPNKKPSDQIVDKPVNKETIVEKLDNVQTQNLNDHEDKIVEENSQNDEKEVLNKSVENISKSTLAKQNNIMMMAGIGLMISAVLLQILLRRQSKLK